VYNLGPDEFIGWYGQERRPGLTKATANAWRGALEARGIGSVSINVRITAVQKLAVEAADNGPPEQMFSLWPDRQWLWQRAAALNGSHEPCDWRQSCTDLCAPRGEIPRSDSAGVR
jgi:hypothetical protein